MSHEGNLYIGKYVMKGLETFGILCQLRSHTSLTRYITQYYTALEELLYSTIYTA